MNRALLVFGLLTACGGTAERDPGPAPAPSSTAPVGTIGTGEDHEIPPISTTPGDAGAPVRPKPDAGTPRTDNDCQYRFQFVCEDMLNYRGRCWCVDRNPYAPNGCRELEDARNSVISDPEMKLLCRVQCRNDNCECDCLNKP